MTITRNDLIRIFGEPQHEQGSYVYKFSTSDGQEACTLKGNYLTLRNEDGLKKTLNLTEQVSDIRIVGETIIIKDFNGSETTHYPLSYTIQSESLLTMDDKGRTVFNDYLAEQWFDSVYRTCKDKETGSIYLYEDGLYVKKSEDDISEMLKRQLMTYGIPFSLSRTKYTDFFHNIYLNAIDCKDIAPKDNCLPFRNGILDVDSEELIPYSPDLYFTDRVDYDYAMDFKSDETEALIRGILPDEDTYEFYLQAVGYTLYSSQISLPMMISLYGDAGTGKSTLIDLLKRVAGPFASNLSPKDMMERFGLDALKGKRVNISEEADTEWHFSDGSKAADMLKSLSAGGTIRVDVKYKDAFDMKNTAKLWFASNHPLNLPDSSEGTMRRIYVIPCKFHHDFNKDIKDYMENSDEPVKWLLSESFKAYKRFVRDGLTYSDEMMDEKSDFRLQDPFNDFIFERFGTLEKTAVSKALEGALIRDLFDEYNRYEKEGQFQKLTSKIEFRNKIKLLFDMEIVDLRPNIGGVRTREPRLVRKAKKIPLTPEQKILDAIKEGVIGKDGIIPEGLLTEKELESLESEQMSVYNEYDSGRLVWKVIRYGNQENG